MRGARTDHRKEREDGDLSCTLTASGVPDFAEEQSGLRGWRSPKPVALIMTRDNWVVCVRMPHPGS